jgi:SNF2 family DNA or RNA helicase
MDFTNKGLLGNAKWFSDSFATPIQQEHDIEKTELFKRLTAPFIMRRMKTDKKVIADLPEKIENNVYSTLTKQQAALYQAVAEQGLEEIARSEGITRRGQVLKMMIALKQIGNHPVQYLKKGDTDPEASGKLQMLLDLTGPVLDANEKMLIFTQYKEMGDILTDVISRQHNIPVLFLHGGSTRKQRDEMVTSFQNHHNQRVFILSLKAGGTGLNLTAATHVFHYDLWWNPAVENQATDRTYRIGQHKNVMVHRLINLGTLEEKIDAMISAKKKLANLTVATGEKWLGELSDQEIKNLVSLDKT